MGHLGFEHGKEQFLAKLDKSKKGSIDSGVKRLVNLINRNPDYYTTSSCSGRSMLIIVPEKGKKWESKWFYTTHGKTSFSELKGNLKEAPEGMVWFKKEGAILHVCCRTIESAADLADAAVKAGFRRSGILARKKIIVEINDTEKIEAPVAMDGRALISDDYLKILVQLANEKQERTKEKIKSFCEYIKIL